MNSVKDESAQSFKIDWKKCAQWGVSTFTFIPSFFTHRSREGDVCTADRKTLLGDTSALMVPYRGTCREGVLCHWASADPGCHRCRMSPVSTDSGCHWAALIQHVADLGCDRAALNLGATDPGCHRSWLSQVNTNTGCHFSALVQGVTAQNWYRVSQS